jgi:hypothetical protein
MARLDKTAPVIVEMPPKKMAVLITVGDPNVEMPKVMPALYGTVYALKFKQLKPAGRDFKVGSLYGRWPDAHRLPKEEWTGIFGLQIPDDVSQLPQKDPEVQVGIETWEYGTVAQILHIGPFSTEGPTVQRLHDFIAESGYEIAGVHEEEYLTKLDAKLQKTVIRYPVRKK